MLEVRLGRHILLERGENLMELGVGKVGQSHGVGRSLDVAVDVICRVGS